jgi:hypothetical protein
MKGMLLAMLSVVVLLSGCATAKKTSKLNLTKSELKQLCSKGNFTLSDSLKKRLLENGDELKLTPEEMQVLKATGKVILCGRCGYIIDSLEYKEQKGKPVTKPLDKHGFVKGSLRDRLIGPFVD